MKLKARLAVAFFTIILVPVILVYVSVLGLCNYQLKEIEKEYGIKASIEVFTTSSIQAFSGLINKIQENIKTQIQDNPDNFADQSFLEDYNNKLKEKYSYIVVRKNGRVIFNGGSDEIIAHLPDKSEKTIDSQRGLYVESEDGDKQTLIKQQTFEFSDGEAGSVFLVTTIDQWLPEMRLMIFEIVLAITIIIVGIASIMVMWLYNTILKPLNLLKDATQKIRDGNLDFELKSNSKDEIGQLCADFEEMRKILKQSSEEKIQFDADNKELISNISHDLKTPITSIKGYVEGIMDGVADTPEKMNRYIKTIYNKANDMDRLIDELTFYSKIDSNKIPYTFTKLNLNSYFSDCAEELGLDLEAKNIEFTYFNYCDEDIMVIGDAEQLKRVINNIISNSVKYIDKKKGIINMRINDVGDFIQVEIEDNGQGIGAKELPYIFDRFYRTDLSRSSSKGGSGIGLSIVKKIIEDHGGKIWATSKEGTGTVMCFVLRKYQEVLHE